MTNHIRACVNKLWACVVSIGLTSARDVSNMFKKLSEKSISTAVDLLLTCMSPTSSGFTLPLSFMEKQNWLLANKIPVSHNSVVVLQKRKKKIPK